MATTERELLCDYRMLLWFTAQHLAVVTEQIVRIEQLFGLPEKERYPWELLEKRLERLKQDHAWLVEEHAIILQKLKTSGYEPLTVLDAPRACFVPADRKSDRFFSSKEEVWRLQSTRVSMFP